MNFKDQYITPPKSIGEKKYLFSGVTGAGLQRLWAQFLVLNFALVSSALVWLEEGLNKKHLEL